MFFVIFLLLALGALAVKNNIKYYDLTVIVFACILTYFGKNVADFDNYENVYNIISLGSVYTDIGLGWYYLCRVGAFLGLNYLQFKVLIIFLSFLLIRSTVNYYIKGQRARIILWGVVLLYPALIELVQVRFLLGEAVTIYALRFLNRRDFKNTVIYLIFVAGAYIIHSACAFYLLFVLVGIFEKIKKLLAVFVVFLSVFIFFGKGIIIKIASMILNSARVERYFSFDDGMGLLGFIAYFFTLFLFLCVSKRLVKMGTAQELALSVEERGFLNLIHQLNMLSALLLPLSMFDTNIFRLQRIMWPLLYMGMMLLYSKGVRDIVLYRIRFKLKSVCAITALCGLVVYICIFNFNIIESFLL